MSENNVETGAEHSPLDVARFNLGMAEKLNGVHPIGAAVLSAFQKDVLVAELGEAEGNLLHSIAESANEDDIDTLLASDDLGELENGLERRARMATILIGDTGDDDPFTFDEENRTRIVRHNGGESAALLLGRVLLVRSRSNIVGARENATPILVGGLRDDYTKPWNHGVPPNPSLFTLSLRPFQAGRRGWRWGSTLGYQDAEQLGQIPNVYFDSSTFSRPYKRAVGHRRAYLSNLGERTFTMPESGNPADIVLEEPKTRLDYLVKFALEAKRIEAKLLELQIKRRTKVNE